MKKKRIQLGRYLGLLSFMLMGAFCGVLMVRAAEKSGGGLLSMATLFFLMYAFIMLQIAAHEAGHLFFGLLSGYTFCSYRIFSFMWQREGEKIRFRRFSLAGTGGQCLMEPPELVDGKIPVVLYNLGGSLMNLIVSAGFLLLWLALGRHPFWSAAVLMCVLIGVVFALMNGIPMRMGNVDNDGYNALALQRDTAALRAFWVIMKISTETARGKRLREMPEEWFVVPSDEAMENSMLATLGVFACNRLMDEHRFAEAEALMQRMLSKASGMAGIYRGLMLCDCVYLELMGENRPEHINNLMDKRQRKLMKSMKDYPAVIRTEYVLALLHDRDHAQTKKMTKHFNKCAKHYPYPGDIESERELMSLAAKIA